MISTFDRYVGKQVLTATFLGVFVLSFVLVVGNMFKKLVSEMERYPDLGWGFVFEFIANILPFSLIFTIPWGLLAAILLTLGKLSANNELVAMRMTGLTLTRICAPIFAISLAAAAISYWMNVRVAPMSKARISQIFFRIATENPGSMFVEDEVVNTLPGFSVYTKSRELIDEKTGTYDIENLVLIKLNKKRQPEIFIQASEARIGFEDGNVENLILKLYEGHIEKTGEAAADGFHSHDLVKVKPPTPQVGDAKRQAAATLQLSLERLREKERKNKPTYLPSSELKKVIDAEENPNRKSYLLTEYHKRYSLSFACLALCLVGIPLGITAQRKETSAGLALSLLVAIVYFFFMVIVELFHDQPQFYPHLMIWLPNAIFIPAGLYLFHRLSRR